MSDAKLGSPAPGSAQEAYRDVLADAADRCAVSGGPNDMTFAQVDRASADVASAIVSERGDVSEPAVVLARDSVTFLIAALGAVRAGRVLVPLDPAQPIAVLERVLHALGPVALLGAGRTQDLATALRRPGDTVLAADEVPAEGRDVGWAARDPESTYRISFTSGSTGAPKGVPRDHKVVTVAARSEASRYGAGDRVPVLFSGARAGIGADPLRVVLRGATVLPVAVRDEGVGRLADVLRNDGATALEGVPSLLRAVLRALEPGEVLEELRLVLTGGEPLFWSDVARLQRHVPHGCELWTGYGASEAGLVTTYRVPLAGDRTGVVPAGHAAAGISLEVVDGRGRPVEPGTTGQIVIRGDRVARGYEGNDHATAARFEVDDRGVAFRSGDLGRLDTDGCLTVVGRDDGMVKVRGQRVELSEVEAALVDIDGVDASAAHATVDSDGNTEIVAFVAARGRVHAEDVVAAARARLRPAAVPRHVRVLDRLPTLANQKVDRAGLRRQWAELQATAVSDAPDHRDYLDDVELTIAAALHRITGRPAPNRRASLLDLGVDSLHLAALFVAIHRRLGVDLPVATVVDAPSISALAEVVRVGEPTWRTVVPIRVVGDRPPLFVIHGGPGNVVFAWPLADRLDPDQPVYGLQYPGVDGRVPPERTLAGLAARYADEIGQVVEPGSVRLCGMSIGGAIAYALAPILRDRGYRVDLVAIVDTALPHGMGSDAGASSHPRGRVRRHLDELAGKTPGARARYVARRLVEWGPYQVRRRMVTRDLARAGRVRPSLRSTFVLGSLAETVSGSRPTPSAEPVLFLRAGEADDARPARGWSALAPTAVVELAGRHGELMRHPNLDTNAELIRRVLAELDEGQAGVLSLSMATVVSGRAGVPT